MPAMPVVIRTPPLVELTLARLREFVREPEALFWTFLFPIIMSVAMAIAFPASGGQTVRVGVSPGSGRPPFDRALRHRGHRRAGDSGR